MTEIRFYHLQTQSQEQALPALLSKALDQGKRIVIKLKDTKDVEFVDDYIWTHNSNSFIPHGSSKTGDAELQPVWLTSEDENPNNADILIVGHGASSAIQEGFQLCCEIFDGRDQQVLAQSRAKWKDYKDKGFEVSYWQQNERGGWDKKA